MDAQDIKWEDAPSTPPTNNNNNELAPNPISTALKEIEDFENQMETWYTEAKEFIETLKQKIKDAEDRIAYLTERLEEEHARTEEAKLRANATQAKLDCFLRYNKISGRAPLGGKDD